MPVSRPLNVTAGTYLWAALAAGLVLGCASFDLPPYPTIVRDAAERTQAIQQAAGMPAVLNRAAQLPGRSQAEIKPQLEVLWHPSLRPLCLANYNGLIATRQSQLEIKPGPMFREGMLTVEHLGVRTEIPYIAAFHPGKRLPLVVGVSGINGTVDGKVTLDVLEHLYDTGCFHVVHIESLTSVSHMVRNQRLFGGGFPEGLLLYETLAELRSRPEYSDQIEQVHLLGISFGAMLCGLAGHCEGVFQAGVLDGAILALSPPLDLKVLFQNLDGVCFIHDRVRKSYLFAGRDQFLKHAHLDLSKKEWAELDFDPYMRKVGFAYVQRNYSALKAKIPDLPPIDSPEDLYAISSLRPFLAQLGVPYYYFLAYDDPVLSPEDHYHQVLLRCPNPLIDGTLVPHGGHLGFDSVCGFPFTAYVAERYFRYWSATSCANRSQR